MDTATTAPAVESQLRPFTVELAFEMPVYRHVTVMATDATHACRLAFEAEDTDPGFWAKPEAKDDAESARATYLSGAWEGEEAYKGTATIPAGFPTDGSGATTIPDESLLLAFALLPILLPAADCYAEQVSQNGDPGRDPRALESLGAAIEAGESLVKGQLNRAAATRALLLGDAETRLAAALRCIEALLPAASAYADDLATGLDDGTYEDGRDRLPALQGAVTFAVMVTEAMQVPPTPSPSADDPTEADYEAAARAAGWNRGGDGAGIIWNTKAWDSWKEALSWSGKEGWPDSPIYSTWQECCEGEDIEPAATPQTPAG